MSEIKSLADGDELNNETWNNFIERLKYHNQGEGVNYHATSYPIFTVREKVTVTGSEDDNVGICCEGEYFDDVNDAFDWLNEETKNTLKSKSEEDAKCSWSNLSDYDKANSIIDVVDDSYIYYWKWDYRTVNSHLTKEAAERFIKSKQHDYGKLSIYVESAYWCWELRTIIDAMMDGRIKYVGDENEKV
ncbi:hypothetical protein ACNA1O_003465 [Proteus mirabilis]|uniref:hypothetical protein n=1 Tax=Proteus TaxID=583 RepID=UPI00299E607A|nr:hypothetical protein [Proteus vulgaris]WOO51066.1 hypothetical protein R2S03_07895 [Hafnia alvei]WPF05538.1 hypothetical protein SB028_06740 [Proteus vulgaris]